MTPDTRTIFILAALLVACGLWALARAVSRAKWGKRFWWSNDDE